MIINAVLQLDQPIETSELCQLLEQRGCKVLAFGREDLLKRPVEVTTFGTISMNHTSHEVFVDGEKVWLAKTQYRILEVFLSEPKKAFSRGEIMDKVWGTDVHIYPRSVDTHVSKLKSLLGKAGDMIQCVHGYGYRISHD